jgi:hypothetical protein
MRRNTLEQIVLVMIYLIVMMPITMATVSHDPGNDVTVTKDSAIINWTTDLDTKGIVQYGDEEVSSDTPTKEHSVELNDLLPNTEYSYTIFEINPENEESTLEAGPFSLKTEADENADTVPPEAVSGLNIKSQTATYVALEWEANTEEDFDHYEISKDSEYLESTTETNYLDNTVSEETMYSYTVIAVDENNNPSAASTISTTTPKKFSITMSQVMP